MSGARGIQHSRIAGADSPQSSPEDLKVVIKTEDHITNRVARLN